MEKVKLTKQGKGWLVSRSSTGKQIICNWRNIPEEWDGKELEADFKSGQPIKFSYDGKVIEKQNFMTKKTNLKSIIGKTKRPELKNETSRIC